MKPLQKGIAIAVIHVLIVLSLGGKLLYDRATRPRVWVRTGSIDPDLPIRGRYFTLNLQVRVVDFKPEDQRKPVFKTQPTYDPGYVDLAVENGELVAHKTDRPTGMTVNSWGRQPSRGPDIFVLSSPVLFFIPEHAEAPHLNRNSDELWAEVTIPRKGPPRPIQLAVKRGDQWTPLTYK